MPTMRSEAYFIVNAQEQVVTSRLLDMLGRRLRWKTEDGYSAWTDPEVESRMFEGFPDEFFGIGIEGQPFRDPVIELMVSGGYEAHDPSNPKTNVKHNVYSFLTVQIHSLATERCEVEIFVEDHPMVPRDGLPFLPKLRKAMAKLWTMDPPPTQPLLPMHPHVPKRPKDLTRWRATWRQVRQDYEKAKSYSFMVGWLSRNHPELECSVDTLADICRAGKAHLLD